jgi:fumarylacetoacetase
MFPFLLSSPLFPLQTKSCGVWGVELAQRKLCALILAQTTKMTTPASTSWIPVSASSHFPIQNIPFGVFKRNSGGAAHIGTAIGDYAVDVYQLAENGLMEGLGFSSAVFLEPTLNSFMELERPSWRAARARLQALLSADGTNTSLSSNERLRASVIVPLAEIQMQMPCVVGDYTDFYSSREHATNVGIMFRGVDNALQPNWLHLPVGYHGRSSSVVVSGTDVVRPCGQVAKNKDDHKLGSDYSSCKLLDFELEMACLLGGKGNPMGEPIQMANAEDRIFGVVVMNDWSARDLQAWEYVPLGPFTAKNFATTISPWVVSLDALEPYRCAPSSGDAQVDPKPLPYIDDPDYARGQYDVTLEIGVKGADDAETSIISTSNLKHMYWNFKQQLVHHAVSGCPMRAGDLLGTGTISGPTKDKPALGSMLELSWRGAREVILEKASSEAGKVRKFLKDGDEVSMVGYTEGGVRIGFGNCVGKILPAGTKRTAAKAEAADGSALPRFVLHSYWRSTCSWRVRIALALYGFQYDYRAVDLAKLVGNTTPMSVFDAEYSAENSMEQVPLLTGAGVKLTQSMAIIEYLEDIAGAASGPRLFPRDPATKAVAREMAELINSGIQPMQNLSVLRQIKTAQLIGQTTETDGKGFATAAMLRGLSKLETLVSNAAVNGTGPFAAGTSYPTIADVCLVPQIYNAGRFGIDVSANFPALAKVNALCATHPAFQAAIPEAQPDAPKA